MGDIDLHSLAVNALAKLPPGAQRGAQVRMAAKIMHDAVGGPLRPLVEAVHRAMDGPPVTLTRAVKERAVAAMTERLTIAAFRLISAHNQKTPNDPDDRAYLLADMAAYARSLARRQAALVRLAMARTVD